MATVRRRAFLKRFSVGVLGCGMLADALTRRSPLEQLQRDMAQFENLPVAEVIESLRGELIEITSYDDGNMRRYL